MRRVVVILACVLAWAFALAQDYTFSNHNIVPFSLNPAQVGAANTIRIGANYRMQWPTLVNNYHTVRLSFDMNVYKQMCSVGAFYSYDQMSDVYKVNEAGVAYAHTIKCADNHFIRLGLQGSVFFNFVDYNALTFGDQYSGTGAIKPASVENFENSSRTFFDFAVGASYVFQNHLIVGFAVYHVAQPDNGFVRGTQVLPRKYVGHVNFIQDLRISHGLRSKGFSDNYFFANLTYQQQADFKQAYIGAGVCFQPIILGVSFKTDVQEVHTVSFMLGGYYKGFQLYYIFDLFTSHKKNGSWSNEISFIYTLPHKKKDLCPVVYW